MSAEIVGGVVAKWMWAPFTAWVLYLIQRREKRIKDLEDDSVNSKAQIALIQQELSVQRENFAKFLEKQDNMVEGIARIRTSVAVIETNVKNINDRG